MTLMERRRGLVAQNTEAFEPVYLYNKGNVSEIVGGINNNGYAKNSSYNTATIASTYLEYRGTSSGGTAAVKGGRTFSFTNPIDAKFIGRKLHVRGSHKATSDSPLDYISVFISDSVANPAVDNFSNAFPGYIAKTITRGTKEEYTEYEFELPITKAGYVSLVGQKNAGGYVYIRFTEVWIA